MKCLLLLSLLAGAKCAENVYMKHSEVEDQQTSASGYAYHLHSGSPFVGTQQLGLGIGGNGAAQVAYPQLFQQFQLPRKEPQELQFQPPHKQIGILPLRPHQQQAIIPLNHYGLQIHPYALHYPLYLGGGVQPLTISNAENFVKGGGSSYSDANKNAHGEQGSQGYKTVEGFDKGQQGKHDNQDHKEYYSQEGGKKVAHNDEGAHYGQKEEAAKGSQGSHFNQQSSHKKGSKTTGFHRVHHKDEFKKDHSFYDESDSSGHFSKHGDYDSYQNAQNGAFEKGGHENKGYKAGEQGVKGFLDKGHFDGQNSGFKGQEGKQTFYNNFEDFGKKGGQQEGKEHGFFNKDILQAQQ